MPAIRREHAFSGLVFIVLAISTMFWKLADRTPPAWDPADHIRTAIAYYRPLSRGQIGVFLHELFQAHHAYAPLFHLMTAVVFLFSGASRSTEVLANFAALAVLIASVNWMGDRLYPQSRSVLRPGVVAAVLAACYHAPAWLLHEAFLDYLLMAAVAFAFALLLRADRFHVRSHAVQFGAAAGLGMLAKQTFPLFFILPGAFLIGRAWMRRDRQAIQNMALSAAIALLIASIWYLPHLNDVIDIYHVNVRGAADDHDPPVASLRSAGYYWIVLMDLQIQLPFGILFITGAAYSVRRRFQKDGMLYLWIWSGILAFTLIANKDSRYTAPVLPAVALISVSWLDALRPKLRSLISAGITVGAFAAFFNAQWPSPNRDVRFTVSGVPFYVLAGDVARFDHAPLPDDWSIPAAVGRASGRLGVVPNIWQLNPSNVALYASLQASPLHVDWLLDGQAPNRLNECDYVLVRSRDDDAEPAAPVEKAVETYIQRYSDRFERVAVFALPHGQEAILYKTSRKLK